MPCRRRVPSRALREVRAGRSVIDPIVVESLVARRERALNSPLNDLTPRESEVLRGMAEGRTNAAIAEKLFLSQSAVEKHVNSIFLKLGLAQDTSVHRRVAAVLTLLRG